MFDRLGPVHYRTAQAEAMISFYRDVLGFQLRTQTPDRVTLGTGNQDLLVLDLVPGVRRVQKATGLYHTAFLVPQHRDLVHMLGRIAVSRTPVEGFNHHGTHEAVYLPDPDGNGVELAWDLAPSEWPRKNGGIDFLAHDKIFDPNAALEEFQADPEPWNGLPVEARVGHVHLHVANLEATEAFYTQFLGMDVMFRWTGNGALFLAADGYHHHVGTNLWKGKNLPPAPADAVGLVDFTWRMPADALAPRRDALESAGHSTEDRPGGFRVLDPAGIGIVVQDSALD